MMTSKSRCQELVSYLEHLSDEESLESLQRILELLYMSEKEELRGAKDMREFNFNNLQVKVFYGNRAND